MVKWIEFKFKKHSVTNTPAVIMAPNEEIPPHVSATVAFRGPSMSVISSSVVLDYGMTSRSPSLQLLNMVSSVDTIHSAIRSFDHDLLQLLLCRMNRDVESPDMGQHGKKPLYLAAEVNNVKATRLLIQYKADPLAPEPSFYGRRPVHIAAAHGCLDVLSYYLNELRSHKNHRFMTLTDSQGQIPLHWAVQRNDVSCTRFLLECGSSVMPLKMYGTNAIQIASAQGSLSLLRLMAEICPQQFRQALTEEYSRDADGCTPLHRAALLDDPELIDFLVQQDSEVNSFDKEGRTPFDMAVTRGSWHTAEALLRHGAEPLSHDTTHGRTAAHHAAMAGQNLAVCDAFANFLDKHPDLLPELDSLDNQGYAALHYAVLSEERTVVQGLLQLRADISVTDREKKSVLHYAAGKRGNLEMMELLLKAATSPAVLLSTVDRNGQSPLHAAAANGHQEIVEFLVARGARSFADDFGHTPLHLAASKNHYTMIKLLLDNHGMIINQIDANGQTALHLAAVKDAARAVVVLLSRGALSIADSRGRTPLELAIKHKSENAALAFVNSAHWKSLVSQRSKDYGTIAQGLVEHLPQVMKACLDRCVDKRTDPVTFEDFIVYDFCLLQSLDRETAHSAVLLRLECPAHIRYDGSPMAVLKTMSQKKRSELLSHPVCRAILEQKWVIYGLYCSLAALLANILFVAILSAVLIASVEAELLPYLTEVSYNNVRKHQPAALNDSDFEKMHDQIRRRGSWGYDGSVLSIILVFALLLILAKEMVDFASEGRRYFKDWTNYIQILLFIVGFAFIICLTEDHTSSDASLVTLTFQLGSVATFLAWLNLLRFCRPFGTFGIYSFMFFTIFKTLIQVSLFFLILTCAFTVSFYTVFQTFVFPDDKEFYDESPLDTADLDTTFKYLHTSGMRIATLMLGDLEAVERFLGPLLKGMMPFPFLGFCFYALCLTMMPILLNNLLMGLSLYDLAAIRRNAALLRLQMQISLHQSLEKLFPLNWLKRIYEKTDAYRCYPTRKLDMRTWIARWLSGEVTPTILAGNSSNYDDEESASTAEKEKTELAQLRRKMQDLDGNMAEIRQLLTQVLHTLDTKNSPAPNESHKSAHD